MDIGTNIRIEMAKRNMTNLELAEKSGLAKSSISLYRNGKQTPSAENLYRVIKAIGCEMTDIVKE